MTREELFDVLRPIIVLVTGVPECILADPNAPAPSGPYASVEPKKNITQRGQANVETRNKAGPLDLDVDVKRQLIAECSVQFYRGAALDFASRLMECNKRPDISTMLHVGGIGWNRTGPVNNLNALQSGKIEDRSQISLFIMYEETDPLVVNSIERISVITENEDGDTLNTFNIETPDAP